MARADLLAQLDVFLFEAGLEAGDLAVGRGVVHGGGQEVAEVAEEGQVPGIGALLVPAGQAQHRKALVPANQWQPDARAVALGKKLALIGETRRLLELVVDARPPLPQHPAGGRARGFGRRHFEPRCTAAELHGETQLRADRLGPAKKADPVRLHQLVNLRRHALEDVAQIEAGVDEVSQPHQQAIALVLSLQGRLGNRLLFAHGLFHRSLFCMTGKKQIHHTVTCGGRSMLRLVFAILTLITTPLAAWAQCQAGIPVYAYPPVIAYAPVQVVQPCPAPVVPCIPALSDPVPVAPCVPLAPPVEARPRRSALMSVPCRATRARPQVREFRSGAPTVAVSYQSEATTVATSYQSFSYEPRDRRTDAGSALTLRNGSENALLVWVDGVRYLLLGDQAVTVDVRKDFVWQIEGRTAERGRIPAGNAALTVVIGR